MDVAEPLGRVEPAIAPPDLTKQYREVIGNFATGVAVITAQSPDGPRGMTVNALCSLSLDPIQLLVCFHRSARTWPVVQETSRFAVNILAEDQHELSGVFASKQGEAEKWAGVAYQIRADVPVLDGVVAWLACELRATHDGGDHLIGVGEVVAMSARDHAHPLVWFRGKYGSLHREHQAEASFPA